MQISVHGHIWFSTPGSTSHARFACHHGVLQLKSHAIFTMPAWVLTRPQGDATDFTAAAAAADKGGEEVNPSRGALPP